MGTNWFMPALVNSRFGESGSRVEDGTMVCPFDLKKSRNDWRISALVILQFNQPQRGAEGAKALQQGGKDSQKVCIKARGTFRTEGLRVFRREGPTQKTPRVKWQERTQIKSGALPPEV